jgi:hypothetical protein
MRRGWLCAMAVLLMPAGAVAQTIQVPANWEKLAARASESVKVDLDRNLLSLAAKFLSDDQADEAGTKRVISGLRGITVRSLEFAKPGEYTEADVEPIRAQLAGWSRMVDVDSRTDGEKVEIFVKTEKDQVAGLVVLAREPKELTFVHIDGPLDPAQLSQLGGHFGIPRGVGKSTGTAPEASPKPPVAK